MLRGWVEEESYLLIVLVDPVHVTASFLSVETKERGHDEWLSKAILVIYLFESLFSDATCNLRRRKGDETCSPHQADGNLRPHIMKTFFKI